VDDELALRFELDSDMSGLIVSGAPTAVTSDSPIVDLLDRLPVPLRSELRMRLRSAGALDPVSLETNAAVRMTRPHAWLLDRIGDDGITLTKAGWLPPAVVHDAMTELGWIDEWIGTANREDNTVPIRALRALATRAGVARVLKGRLVLTAAGRKLRDDPVALWHHLATTLVARAGSDARSDAIVLLAVEIACGGRDSFTRYGAAIASGLDAIGWSLADGEALTGTDALALVGDTWQALSALGVLRRKRWNDGAPTPEGQTFARAMLTG
jgi:hypothetical protein